MAQHASYPLAIPADEEGRLALLKQLDTWSRAAKPAKLDHLDLGAKVVVPESYIHGLAQDRYEPARTDYTPGQSRFHLPAEPRERAKDLILQRVVNLVRLGIADETASTKAQVYKGQMTRQNGSVLPVVAKVYQGSLNPESHWLQVPPRRLKDDQYWTKVLLPYQSELWAYNRMKDLQGIVVPHIYGCFQVILPSQEPAVVMIMEYIDPSRQMLDVMKITPETPLDSRDVFRDMAMGMLAAVHAISDCGVYPKDISIGNTFWPPGDHVKIDYDGLDLLELPAKGVWVPLPVLVDFVGSKPLGKGYPREDALYNALQTVCKYTVYLDVVNPWWDWAFKSSSFVLKAFDITEERAEKFYRRAMRPCKGIGWVGVEIRET